MLCLWPGGRRLANVSRAGHAREGEGGAGAGAASPRGAPAGGVRGAARLGAQAKRCSQAGPA
eukprot:scaffold1124_cov361-Prasinococcus_capsulatus_cf.AAC.23